MTDETRGYPDEALKHDVYDIDGWNLIGAIHTAHRVRAGEWVEFHPRTGSEKALGYVERVVWGNDDLALNLGPDLYIRVET